MKIVLEFDERDYSMLKELFATARAQGLFDYPESFNATLINEAVHQMDKAVSFAQRYGMGPAKMQELFKTDLAEVEARYYAAIFKENQP